MGMGMGMGMGQWVSTLPKLGNLLLVKHCTIVWTTLYLREKLQTSSEECGSDEVLAVFLKLKGPGDSFSFLYLLLCQTFPSFLNPWKRKKMKEKVGHMKLLRDQAVSLHSGMAKEIKLTRSQQSSQQIGDLKLMKMFKLGLIRCVSIK
ncbi:hypothetical protein K2173_012066 [Erythroxylum novogranatense]|uniref:Uncharacterized protein n=1 Tax=Erythroxylum novogranatense TaxID=1862640 RepID=A0AAV8TGI4_9ROSI|nr:hypothetical protein K2173_012066 [Erythroxylum novogranatense]